MAIRLFYRWFVFDEWRTKLFSFFYFHVATRWFLPFINFSRLNDVASAPHPPKYQSQGSIEKKPPSDDMDDQDSYGDYGEDSRMHEDSSFIDQYGEEKRREAEEEEEESDEPDDATFV